MRDATSGKEIWRKDYEKDFGAERPEWGFTGMPLIDGDNVIFPPGGDDGDLVALEKKTGKLVWRSKDFSDSIHYSSPLLVEIGGVRQIVQLTGKVWPACGPAMASSFGGSIARARWR